MRFDLSRFKSGIDRIDRTYEPGAFVSASADTDDFRVAEPVALTLNVTKTGNRVHLVGRVVATLDVLCSRCLEAYRVPVNASVNLTFYPATDPVATAKPARTSPKSDDDDGDEVKEDDLGVSFYTDDYIDLEQIMREQFYLALPMKPLCTPDCKGLCPDCGINRNRETCSCVSTWVDPRFDALRNLTKHD
jgi:uncharacterized protein